MKKVEYVIQVKGGNYADWKDWECDIKGKGEAVSKRDTLRQCYSKNSMFQFQTIKRTTITEITEEVIE